jgi:Stage II sporulation protein E (SpoIIE)
MLKRVVHEVSTFCAVLCPLSNRPACSGADGWSPLGDRRIGAGHSCARWSVAISYCTLRTLAEATDEPTEILAGLNRRLHGRLNNGFATCLVLRFDSEGNCVLANAGHLPPFLNQEEMSLPGALPLALDLNATYERIAFRLAVGDRLTFYTDGLLEARNVAGEIFSFDRLQALMATKPDAKQAAEAAVAFGQDDDITVLTLTRLAIGVKPTTSLLAPGTLPATA